MTTKVVCVAPKKASTKQNENSQVPPSNPARTPDADQIRRKWLKEMASVIATPTLQSTTA